MIDPQIRQQELIAAVEKFLQVVKNENYHNGGLRYAPTAVKFSWNQNGAEIAAEYIDGRGTIFLGDK